MKIFVVLEKNPLGATDLIARISTLGGVVNLISSRGTTEIEIYLIRSGLSNSANSILKKMKISKLNFLDQPYPPLKGAAEIKVLRGAAKTNRPKDLLGFSF